MGEDVVWGGWSSGGRAFLALVLAGPFVLTGTADATSGGADADVRSDIGMASRALGLPAILGGRPSAAHGGVLVLRDGLKVLGRRVHAAAIAAHVVDGEAVRNRTNERFVCDAMRARRKISAAIDISDVEDRVAALRDPSGPFEASVWRTHRLSLEARENFEEPSALRVVQQRASFQCHAKPQPITGSANV